MKGRPFSLGGWMAGLIWVILLVGQGSAWSQGANPPATFGLAPLFSSQRANLEIEVMKVPEGPYFGQGGGYRVYLVDRSCKDALGVVTPQRVYQFEDLDSDMVPVACLDDACHLYVLTRRQGKLTVRCYDPTTTYSATFTEDLIKEPNLWVTWLVGLDRSGAGNGVPGLFGGEEFINQKLQKVSTDELVPNSVKEEQGRKLRQGLVTLLNERLLGWTVNLDALLTKQGPRRRTVQELWLAKDVQKTRATLKPNGAAPEEYWHKLRLLNRMVLAEVLYDYSHEASGILTGNHEVFCSLRSLVPPTWTTEVPLRAGQVVALQGDVLVATPGGTINVRWHPWEPPIVMDAATGKIVAP